MTSLRFDSSSTSVRPQKPWTSPFYGSMNGPNLKTLLISHNWRAKDKKEEKKKRPSDITFQFSSTQTLKYGIWTLKIQHHRRVDSHEPAKSWDQSNWAFFLFLGLNPLARLSISKARTIRKHGLTFFSQLGHLTSPHTTKKKMPISDQEFITDPKSPLKKSYLWWQNKALANTW